MAGDSHIFKINPHFVKWKLLYTLSEASRGPYLFFMVNFYLTRGLTYEDAGFIESIVPFLGCLFRPSVCYFADRFALHRSLLSLSFFVYSLSLAGFALLSIQFQYVVKEPVNLMLNGTDVTNTTNEFVLGKYPSEHRDFLFPIFCGLRFLCTLGVTPASSLLDGLVYHSLEEQGEANNYGRQRLWGSIGFSIFALLSSFLLDEIEHYNFLIGFSMAFAAAFAAMIASFCLVESYQTIKKEAKTEADVGLVDKHTTSQSHFVLVFKFTFGDPHILVSLAVAGAVGYLTACREVFASQYIEELTQTNSKKIFGVTQAMLGTLEIPVMFISGWLLHKFGTLVFMATSFAAFTLRFWLFTVLTSDTAWFFVAVEILHLFCFALVAPAFTYQAHRRVVKYQNKLPEMSAIIQGLVSAMYLGLGYGIGCIIGGVLTQRYGGDICMRIFAITAFVCFVLFCIVWLALVFFGPKGRKRRSIELEDPNAASHIN